MDALLDQFGQAIGRILDDPTVRLGATIAAGYVVILWLACALWAFVDLRRRTSSLIWPYVAAAGVILATPLLFPLAILVHVIVRPSGTVAERRLNALRDASLGLEIDRPTCSTCGAPVDEEWLLCPRCRTALAHRCDRCGRVAGIDWEACAWCGALLGPPAGAIAH